MVELICPLTYSSAHSRILVCSLTYTHMLTHVLVCSLRYVSDVGKALYDCELPYASERVFLGCSLFSGILSTHKNVVKVVK